TAPHAGLGPGQGDGGARAVHHGYEYDGLLLRPPQPVATREQREHERPPRRYFPRTADLSLHGAAHPSAVASELNDRPRQTLNWMKPSEVFSRSVASIG